MIQLINRESRVSLKFNFFWFIILKFYTILSGLFKSEFKMTSGSAIFLSPKCYLMDNGIPNDPNGVKRALKGISEKTVLDKSDFIDALYLNKTVIKPQIRMKRDTKTCKIRIVEEQKKSLNSIYYKMKLSEDYLSCSPHDRDL